MPVGARIALALGALAAFVAAPRLLAQVAPGPKQAEARPIAGHAPDIDGHPNEAVWNTAAWFSDFVQKDPIEGHEPRERTEVAFLYDADALYIAARMQRSPTGELPHPVTRRDQFSNAEHLVIALDTYHDRRTGFNFTVSSGGVRIDYYNPTDEEDNRDFGFDPVWEAKAVVDSAGWTTEMRIPFSQLRFNPGDAQVWGLNINRWMPGSNEDLYWVMIPKNETGFYSRFGDLVGISGIRPSRRLELLPYVAGDARFQSGLDPADPFNDGSEYLGRAGMDMKMGLGPNLTLDATVNPDFGQVDADPAEVNLTAFETFFPERRPFFTEGNRLLTGTGPGYFYSRRIGDAPRGTSAEDFVDGPDYTTIIGAAKVTGRTSRGLSVGALAAVTSRESAQTFDVPNDKYGQVRIAPLSAFAATHLQQEFGRSSSTFGVSLTGMERDVPEGDPLADIYTRRAYTGGVDWNLRFQGGAYSLSGYAGFSYVAGDSIRMADVQAASARYYQRPDIDYVRFDPGRTSLAGYTAGLGFSKAAGRHWLYDVLGATESPGFELNDMGRLSTADDIDVDANLRYRETRPSRLLHRYSVGLFNHVNWNYGLQRQFTRIATSASLTWKGYQQTFLGAYVLPGTQSDDLTRGGPLMASPTAWGTDFSFHTNEAGNLQAGMDGNLEWDEFDGHSANIGLLLSIRPGSRWFLSIAPRYQRGLNARQYVDTQAGGTAATYGQRYIFASLDQTTISAQVRLNYSLTSDLTFEGYLEPFAASGAYTRLGELPAARSETLRRYGTDGTTIEALGSDSLLITDNGGADSVRIANPDFNVLSFRSNLVLRWEWRPGSTLFLVWQASRGEDSISDAQVHAGDLWSAFRSTGDNFLALKITYWLGIG